MEAFTKNAEVYLAPGEGEETLKHELGHVIQQKKEKIPATTKIGERQVNLDPKLEQEADEFAKHIEDHIPEIISNKSTNTETKNIVQFAPISDEDLRKKILEEARNLAIPNMHTLIALKLDDIVEEFRKKESDTGKYLKSWYWPNKWSDYFKSYVRICITEVLEEIQAKYSSKDFENTPDYNLYRALDESKTLGSEQEKARITEIMDMLSTEKIFPTDTNSSATLHTIMSWLTPEQCEEIKNCILKLKECCQSKGVRSVLEGADVNMHPKLGTMLKSPGSSIPVDIVNALAESFIKRLKLMTSYIESVYNKYHKYFWIESTGSDPHAKGKHALFLIHKKTGKKFVYKPHSLKADAAIVGKEGIFAEINNRIHKGFTEKCTELGLPSGTIGNGALATMRVFIHSDNPDVGANGVEEFIKKDGKMNHQEAKLYFFRAGILKAITDVMAVIDLHQENIMPTKNGPMIIDAEVDFFEYTDSGLVHAGLSKNEDSSFKIGDGQVDSESCSSSGECFNPQKDDTVRLDKRLPKNLNYNSEYFISDFLDGYEFMRNELQSNENIFAGMYETQLEKVDKVRIVPISTMEFANILSNGIICAKTDDVNYVDKENRHSPMNRNDFASSTADRIEVELKKGTFIFGENKNGDSVTTLEVSGKSEKLTVELYDHKNTLTNAIRETFNNGTIIAMYADMNGVIYLDDTPVGIVKLGEHNVINEELVRIMKEKFLKKVFDLPEFPQYLSLTSDAEKSLIGLRTKLVSER